MVLHTLVERVAVHQSTDYTHTQKKVKKSVKINEFVLMYNGHTRVAFASGSAVIEFTSIIAFEYVDMGEITYSSDLNVVGGFDKVDAVKCPVRDNTSAMT